MTMIAADVQIAFQRLQTALGLSLVCGQITLNVNNGELASTTCAEPLEFGAVTRFMRIPSRKPLDKHKASA